MVNYENGKIYRLKSKSTNQSYIGSTAMSYLSQRLAIHLTDYKRYLTNKEKYRCITSFKILECEDYEIELICDFPCANKQQLEREEGKFIKLEKEENKYTCVNKVIAGRTHKEYLEEHKEEIKEQYKKYREENKEKRTEQFKNHYYNNQEYHKERWQKYYEEKKDNINERKKKYREENKEKIKEYNKKMSEIIVICEICGQEITKNHLKRHQQTKKCQSVVYN